MKQRSILSIGRRLGGLAVVVALGMVFAPKVEALSLREALARIGQTVEVRAAERVLQQASVEAGNAVLPADPSLAVTPSVRMGGADGSAAPEFTTISASAAIAWPVGLSAEARTRAARSFDATLTAAAALDAARNEQAIKIARQYFAARLTVREEQVLRAELAAARTRAETERARYERGEIAYVALAAAEDALLDAQTELSSLAYARDTALPLLALTLGMNAADLTESMLSSLHTGDAVGRAGASVVGNLPPKQDLIEWALANHPIIVRQRVAIEALERELGVTSTALSLTNVRAGFDTAAHSIGATYNPVNPTVGLTYAPSGYTIGTAPRSSSSSADWTISLGVTVSLQGNSATNRGREATQLELARLRDQLGYTVQQVSIEVAAAYNAIERAGESLRRAQQNLERARENQAVVEQRVARGLAGALDAAVAAARTQRAIFVETRSWIAVQEAALSAAGAAAYAAHIFGGTQ